MNKQPITQQQRRFLNEYSETLNLEKSAQQAGYKSTNAKAQAAALLQKEHYCKELEKIAQQKASYLNICKAYVVKKYLELVEYATFQDNGLPKDPTLGLRALDGLCKVLPKEGSATDADTITTKIEGLNHDKI